MTRAFRIELRRSNAPATALLLIAAGGLLVGSTYGYWRGSSGLAAYETSLSLPFLVPITLAYGAMLGRREKRTRAVELMESTGRPRWQRFLPSTAALAVATAGTFLLLAAAVAVTIAAGGGHLSPWDVVTPLVSALILAGAGWLGIAAGRAWSSPILPPALAAGMLVVLFFNSANPLDGRYSRWTNLSLDAVPGPATPWETPTVAAHLARLALALALVTAGFLLIAGRSWASRAGAGAVLAAGLAGLLLIVSPGAAGKWRLDPSAQRLVCADGTPQVCVTAVHRHLLPDVAAQARRALDALAVLPGAPTRAAEVRLDTIGDFSPEQWHRFTPDDEAGTVYFALGYDIVTGRDPGVAQRIVLGGGTYLSRCGPQADVDVPMAVAGAWLLRDDEFRVWDPSFGYLTSDPIQPEIRERLRALRTLPEAEQLARVTAVRDAALRCEPDLMTPLTGGTAS